MVQVKPKAKLTYDDYANLPGDERYELIDGELILVASPNEKHQWTSKTVLANATRRRHGTGTAILCSF